MSKRNNLQRQKLAETRLLAVRRVLSGEKASDVMRDLRLDRSTIYAWLKRYKTEGPSAFQAKPITGRAPKLGEKAIKQLCSDLSNQKGQLWSTESLAAHIETTFSLQLGKTALNHVLRTMGVTHQRLKRLFDQKLQFGKRSWVENEYPLILAETKRKGAALYFLSISHHPAEPYILSATTPAGRPFFSVFQQTPGGKDVERFISGLLSQEEERGKLTLIFGTEPGLQNTLNTAAVNAFLSERENHIKTYTLGDAVSTAAASPKKNQDNLPTPPETIVPPLFDIESWISLINQNLLDPLHPFEAFLHALNTHYEASAIISPNIHIPSSPIRPVMEGFDMAHTIEMNQVMRETWPASPFLKAMKKPGDMFLLDELLPFEAWPDNIYCKQLLERMDGQHGHFIGLAFAGPNNTLSGLFIFKRIGQTEFTKSDREFLSRLRPHLEPAIGVVLNNLHTSFILNSLEEATNHMDFAAFILDGNGRMIKQNRIADDLLEQKGRLSLRDGQLKFGHGKGQRQFDEAVRQAITWRQAPLGEKPINIMRFTYPDEDWLGILVRPISPPTMEAPHSMAVSPHIAVYISSPGKPKQTIQHQLVVQLFNLSPREAHLATLLSSGHSLESASHVMTITLTSARTYLQRIYEKTGVNRQQDLTQRISTSVAMLA